MAPRILIFSIAIGADYSYEVENSEIWVPTFFKHNNSSVATMIHLYFDKAAQIEKVEFACKNYDLKKNLFSAE